MSSSNQDVDSDQCDMKGMLLSLKTDIQELKSSMSQMEVNY